MNKTLNHLLLLSLLAVGGIMGWYAHKQYATPNITIHQDSIVVRNNITPPKIIIHPEIIFNDISHKVIGKTNNKKIYTYKDSFKVVNDSVNINANVRVMVNKDSMDNALFSWNVKYKPITELVNHYIEKIKYKTKEITKPLPFYRDNWFYTSIVSLIVTIYIIINILI